MLTIDGAEVQVDGAQAAIDAAEAKHAAKVAELEKQLAAAKSSQDAAEKALAEQTSDAAKEQWVKDAQERAEAKAAAEKRIAEVKAAYPTISLDGKSEAYVDGLYAALQEAKNKDPENLAAVNRAPTKASDAAPRRKSPRDAYEAMRAADRAASLALKDGKLD